MSHLTTNKNIIGNTVWDMCGNIGYVESFNVFACVLLMLWGHESVNTSTFPYSDKAHAPTM